MPDPTAKRPKPAPPTEPCLFGSNCYRRNPHHFREYAHSHLATLAEKYGPSETIPASEMEMLEPEEDVILQQLKMYRDVFGLNVKKVEKKTEPEKAKNIPDAKPVLNKKMTVLEKLKHAEPFNLFLTKVKDSPATHNDPLSLFITDLLHPMLGKLKRSLQINFMVEWEWLKMNYEVMKCDDKPLLILHGEENAELHASNLPDHVRALRIRSKYPFGTHHTKLMLLQYEDESVRVVVSTANLVGSDWENRTQGLWVSPKCPKLADPCKSGESPTGFKFALLRYLHYYEVSALKGYTDAVKACDFSAVNAVFVSSVPNSHKGTDLNKWGHRALSAALSKHCAADTASWPIMMQCSSIGSLGASPELWFKNEFGRCLSSVSGLSSGTLPPISLIYPSKRDVERSHDGLLGGGCLPYSRRTAEKQPWLDRFLCRWRSDSRTRSQAMPHVKSYTRVSPDCQHAAYFHLTSANLSKAAWGSLSKGKDSLMIMSYEAGVLLLPKFVTGKAHFELGTELKLPYDVPVQDYAADDSVWLMDYLREAV